MLDFSLTEYHLSRLKCRIIRTTELAAAQEKLNELERKKEDALKFYSPVSLIHRLQGNSFSVLIFLYDFFFFSKF